MRALFEKDLRLILTRKSTLFIFLIIGVGFTWSFSSSYSGAYLTMLGTMLALSTISFDDSDNCMAFLFTLPCTRKQYVLEKYLFVYGVSLLAGLIGLVIIIMSSIVKGSVIGETLIIETLASEIPILVITGGLMIPLQLKFGPEKSRIVLLLIFGVLMMVGFLISKNGFANIAIEHISNFINRSSPIVPLLLSFAVLAIIVTISIIISSMIVKNKEY